MSPYDINKGIGSTPEFKGLKSQYLFLFAGGLLGIFILTVVLYLIGINQFFCIGLGIILGSLLVWMTFQANSKYGEHGLMKLRSKHKHPYYLINRLRTTQLFKPQKQNLK